ncbi:MAG TPA: serine protease [Cyclobacteriaceae bacterium]|nr:serine protease [Cyclobacteriaceae bacterium]
MIRVGKFLGTSFVASYNTRSFLITAKHLFKENLKSGDSVSFIISYAKTSEKIRGRVFFSDQDKIDIAVIPMNVFAKGCFTLSDSTSLKLGQECMILGFPLGLRTEAIGEYIPFLKRGYFSGYNDKTAGEYMFDLYGNHGFSGGPVIIRDSTDSFYNVVAVVSGGFIELKEGRVKGNDSTQSQTVIFEANSGMMRAFSTINILKIIDRNKLY